MQAALDGFNLSISRVRNLAGLHGALASLTTGVVDSSDLLRAQIVLTVSALDYFMHEITVLGMLQIFHGTRVPTDAFKRQKLSGYLVLGARSAAAFEEDVRLRHSFLSFQHPDKIAEAFRLICDKQLWAEVGIILGMTDSAVKSQLRLIVDRRNKIAHEADIDPSFPGARWPISTAHAAFSVKFIEDVCHAIFVASI